MSTTVHPSVLALLLELSKVTDEVIHRHFTQAEEDPNNLLTYMYPLQIDVRNNDGILARFWEDGIELEPEEEQ